MRWLKLELNENVKIKCTMSVIYAFVLLCVCCEVSIGDEISTGDDHQLHQQPQHHHQQQQQQYQQQKQQIHHYHADKQLKNIGQPIPSPVPQPGIGNVPVATMHRSVAGGGGVGVDNIYANEKIANTGGGSGIGGGNSPGGYEARNSYSLLSRAMSQAVIHEMSKLYFYF